MIIEFTGVPCCGKSDISHELANVLKENGYSVCEKQYENSHNGGKLKRIFVKSASAFLYTFLHPVKSLSSLKILGSVGLWTNYLYLANHKCNKDFCILEQGICQLIGSTFDNSDPEYDKIDRLISNVLPRKDRIQIFVTASIDTVRDRAAKRSDTPFYMTVNDTDKAIRQSFEIAGMLKACCSEQIGKDKVFEVSNDKENGQRQSAEKIFDSLTKQGIL